MRRTGLLALWLAVGGCGGSVPSAPVQPAPPPRAARTMPPPTQAAGPVVIIPPAVARVQTIVAPLEPGCLSCNLFGLSHRADGWYVALAEQRSTDSGTEERAGARRVTQGALGDLPPGPNRATPGNWPIALLESSPGTPAPWMVTSREGFGWMVQQVGAGRGTGLGSGRWPELGAAITRVGWQVDPVPRAYVLWERETTRPYTAAERRAHEREAERARQQGMYVDFASAETVRTSLYASVATPTSRHDELISDVSAQSGISFFSPIAVATARGGLVGFRADPPDGSGRPRTEHWYWLDPNGSLTAHRPEPAIAGIVEAAHLGDDGVALVASSELDIAQNRSTVTIRMMPRSGPLRGTQTFAVEGNVDDSYFTLGCGGRTWLVLDVFQSSDGSRALEARAIGPVGETTATVALGALPGRREPSRPGSRPASPTYLACAGDEAALAMLVPLEQRDQEGVALVTWRTSP